MIQLAIKREYSSFLYFTKDSQILLIYIASYDTGSGHVSVVISTE